MLRTGFKVLGGCVVGTEFEVKVAGTFAADKFIVIKRVEERVESNPNPNLKQHHA